MKTPLNEDDYRKGASDYANEELERLRAENNHLRRLLSEHGISITASPVKQTEAHVPTSLQPSDGNLTLSSTAEEKIAHFRRLFRGRDDVYAIRWRGKDGKTGYSPASLKNWDKRDAQGRPERTFLPLTHEAVQNHLTGREIIGVYPLLPDETCWFLAADFDKEGWQEDALAFVRTCKASGIPVALERSRSGKGGHVWIFFQDKIPATIARKLGTALLTRTMERRHQIGLDSYDRLFPNQDTMPKGGFGNLIALPLQAEPRKEGNSVFVDECFNAYPDQWEYLSRRTLVTLAEVEAVVTEIERSGSLIGLRSFDDDDDESNRALPWQAPRSLTAEKLPIDSPLPTEVRIVRANLVYVDKTGLPSSFLNRVLRIAAFQNPEFYRNQAMRLSTFGKPRVIRCGDELPLFIGLPRGCFQDVMDLMRIHSIQPNIQDERITGTTLPLKFHGTLFPEQEKAVRSLIVHDDGVLAATTAFGKTVVAARMIAERGVNTLVLVHRKQLLDQWRERLAAFLDIPIREIGAIGGGKKAPTKNLDVAVIQSLGRTGEINEVVAEYGHVIVDECHHLSAFSFEQVLRKVKA
ncbi:MAG: DEAD/DEAH box helicase family protein, partial [Verrucomicrobiota bacterium]